MHEELDTLWHFVMSIAGSTVNVIMSQYSDMYVNAILSLLEATDSYYQLTVWISDFIRHFSFSTLSY